MLLVLVKDNSNYLVVKGLSVFWFIIVGLIVGVVEIGM